MSLKIKLCGFLIYLVIYIILVFLLLILFFISNLMWSVCFFDNRFNQYRIVKGFSRLTFWLARKYRVELNRKYPELSFISVPIN